MCVCDVSFSGYSDAHMALNGTMIIFIINALIFYDTTTFTKAMLVWYCVGTSALLGTWVAWANDQGLCRTAVSVWEGRWMQA